MDKIRINSAGIKSIIAVVFFISLNNVSQTQPSKSQIKEDNSAPCYTCCMNENLGVETIFNTKDIFLGFSYENIFSRELNIGYNLFIYGRPFEKTVFIEKETNHYYQYKEYRFIFGGTIEKYFFLSKSGGLTIGGGGVYTIGYYSGSNETALKQWSPIGATALFYSIADSYKIKGGYKFISIPQSPDHFIYISLSKLFLTESSPCPHHESKKQ